MCSGDASVKALVRHRSATGAGFFIAILRSIHLITARRIRSIFDHYLQLVSGHQALDRTKSSWRVSCLTSR
jgi:hypothetical protein